MGVHKAPPLLYKKESTNPLQSDAVYGCDVSTLLYAIISCAGVYRSMRRDPPASVKHEVFSWLDEWYEVHEFERLNIKLIYVFDGHEINLKRTRRALRRELKRRLQARLAASTT